MLICKYQYYNNNNDRLVNTTQVHYYTQTAQHIVGVHFRICSVVIN